MLGSAFVFCVSYVGHWVCLFICWGNYVGQCVGLFFVSYLGHWVCLFLVWGIYV